MNASLNAYFLCWGSLLTNVAFAEFKPIITLHNPIKVSRGKETREERAKMFNIEACQDYLNKDYQNRIQYELVLGSYFNKVPVQAFLTQLANFNPEKNGLTEKELLNADKQINEILKLYANTAIDHSRDDALREDIPLLRNAIKSTLECYQNYLSCSLGFKEYAEYEALKNISEFQNEINRNISSSNAEILNKIDRWAFEKERQYKEAVDKKDLVKIEVLRLTASKIPQLFTINESLSDFPLPLTKLTPQEMERAMNRMKMMQDNIAASSPYKYIDKMTAEAEKKKEFKSNGRLINIPYQYPTK